MILVFTGPSTPAKTGALGSGLSYHILYDPMILFFTGPSTPAKTGALGSGLSYHILSYFALPARVPLQKLGL